jgi:hypothetical protein
MGLNGDGWLILRHWFVYISSQSLLAGRMV